MMNWYWVCIYSLLVPIALRPLFPSNLEFICICLFCGVLYGFIASAVKH